MSEVKVYCYHGVVPRKADAYLDRNFHLVSKFREHLRRLEGSRFLSLDELEQALGAPRRSGPPAVMLTFDDGYANNLAAAEILARRRIPWCLFVSTGGIGRDRTTWPNELSLLLLHGRRPPGRPPRIETLGCLWPLGSREERLLACEVIRRRLKALPKAGRVSALDGIRAQFRPGETERLLREFPSTGSLTWKEVAELSRSGVEIGSHGVFHEPHNARQPRAVRRFELTRSRGELGERLGRPCRSFAYPNGDHAPGSASLAEAAGYLFAFTIVAKPADASSNRFLLPRLEPETIA